MDTPLQTSVLQRRYISQIECGNLSIVDDTAAWGCSTDPLSCRLHDRLQLAGPLRYRIPALVEESSNNNLGCTWRPYCMAADTVERTVWHVLYGPT